MAGLMPDTAERLTKGRDGAGARPAGDRIQTDDTEEVPISELSEDDVVLVHPGASVPAGVSSVDESMITGESRPIDKTPGSEVVAGTINQDGNLRVRVTKTGEEAVLRTRWSAQGIYRFS